MILETKRLVLRSWRESDAEELYKYASDSDIGPIAGWPVHTSVENSREIIKNVLSAENTFAVILKDTGLPIGSIGIMKNANIPTAENESEIGYWLGKPYWGQGLIPEAVNECLRYCFVDLNCTKVWCGYYDGNEKSRRVQEKCGFKYHHTEKDKLCPLMNDIRTEHISVITKEEWHANKKSVKKNLYMIGGTMGVGKTTTCQILKNKLNNSVFLDGDWCWDMNPFKITEETKSMVMNNIGYLLNSFIRCSEYDNIIFCWVMHEQSIIDNIINRLEIKNVNTYLISLMCSENSLKDRLEKDINNGIRTNDVTEKSVSRIPLYDKLNTIKIDVSEISAEDAAEKIKEISFKQTLSMQTV